LNGRLATGRQCSGIGEPVTCAKVCNPSGIEQAASLVAEGIAASAQVDVAGHCPEVVDLLATGTFALDGVFTACRDGAEVHNPVDVTVLEVDAIATCRSARYGGSCSDPDRAVANADCVVHVDGVGVAAGRVDIAGRGDPNRPAAAVGSDAVRASAGRRNVAGRHDRH
jgi:hypothetical protein